MNKLFGNEFIDVLLYQKERIVSGVWQSTQDVDFEDAQFRESMLAWFEQVRNITNVNVLADTRLFTFTITPETQLWINDSVIGLYPQYGVAKLGFLLSKDFFSQVSIEQTIEEKPQEFQVRYFEHEEEAIQWLSKEQVIAH